MAQKEENRSQWLKVRLTPNERALLDQRFRASAFSNLSEYGRALILGSPVTVIHRDKAMDEILEELAGLRKELNAVGNNLNQAVRSINISHGNADNRLWAALLSVITGKIDPVVQQIFERIKTYGVLWSQKLKAERT